MVSSSRWINSNWSFYVSALWVIIHPIISLPMNKLKSMLYHVWVYLLFLRWINSHRCLIQYDRLVFCDSLLSVTRHEWIQMKIARCFATKVNRKLIKHRRYKFNTGIMVEMQTPRKASVRSLKYHTTFTKCW